MPLVVAVDRAAGAFDVGDHLGLVLRRGVVHDLDVVGLDLRGHGAHFVSEWPDVLGVDHVQHLRQHGSVGDPAAFQQGHDLDAALQRAGDDDVDALGGREAALERDGQQAVGVVDGVVRVLDRRRALPVGLHDEGVGQKCAAALEGFAVVDREGLADGFLLADGLCVHDGAVGRHYPVDVSLFRARGGSLGGRQTDPLAEAVVALGGVGLAVIASGRFGQIGDGLDVGDQVDKGGDRAGCVAVELRAVAHGRGRHLHRVGASLQHSDLVGCKIVFAVRRHLRPLRNDDVFLLRRGDREAHGRLGRCAFQSFHILSLADGVQYLAPRIAEERLPAGVVEAVVEGNEHGHESLAEDPALVARVERLAGALFELGDDGLV